MNKYIYSAKMALIDLAAYPSRFFSNIWIDGISLLVYFFLWGTLFSDNTEVNGYTLKGITTYYALTFTLRQLTNSKDITRRISYNIRYGTLSTFLLQPIDFTLHYFFRLFTQVGFQTLVPFMMVFGLTFFAGVLETPKNFGFFVLSTFFGALITFLFYAITGCIAFWTIQSWGINSMIGRITSVLSGALIPLSFFPQYLQNINDFFPFKHMSYTAISIYIGNLTGTAIYTNLLLQIWWILVLYVIYKIIWNKALRKYDSVGG